MHLKGCHRGWLRAVAFNKGGRDFNSRPFFGSSPAEGWPSKVAERGAAIFIKTVKSRSKRNERALFIRYLRFCGSFSINKGTTFRFYTISPNSKQIAELRSVSQTNRR